MLLTAIVGALFTSGGAPSSPGACNRTEADGSTVAEAVPASGIDATVACAWMRSGALAPGVTFVETPIWSERLLPATTSASVMPNDDEALSWKTGAVHGSST